MAWENLPSTNTPLNATNLNKITDSGSNANGQYIKLQDGTLICYGTININNYTVGISLITFPIELYTITGANIYTQQAYTGSHYTFNISCVAQVNSKQNGYLYIRDVNGNTISDNDIRFNWLLIGKWK